MSDFSVFKTDLHSHLIPGIDDGVKDMDEAVDMISKLHGLGFTKLITTPHVMSDYFRNTPEIIESGLEDLKKAVIKAGIPVQLEAAAEYYLDEFLINKIQNERLLTIGGKYLLFEVSYINPPDNILNVIFEITVRGYTPLLAHPERYPFWYEKFDEYRKLKEAGVLFQLNTNSLCGYYGGPAKKIAEKLIDENMIDFIGSDLHGARHLESLKKVISEKHLWKLAEIGVRNAAL
ncbi:MAG: capsular biosynthesis protein [Bacteroidetes bacterium]|nr:MAG: capsular biosynthesis protein [Bacteroidota bacterium]REK05354.1 MAG: capsular biosynthesis protein [Bacteroidota bacterium]REK32728.1 MAG: capsular biosynthesis protein [Bacteroidota bacterium]REK49077.1 MAG: capsular biosynthesis protein [Bacteroidota bacterium]